MLGSCAEHRGDLGTQGSGTQAELRTGHTRSSAGGRGDVFDLGLPPPQGLAPTILRVNFPPPFTGLTLSSHNTPWRSPGQRGANREGPRALEAD